jgi:hypothetical protein
MCNTQLYLRQCLVLVYNREVVKLQMGITYGNPAYLRVPRIIVCASGMLYLSKETFVSSHLLDTL